MSKVDVDTRSELQTIADRVVERAQPGEQLEVFVGRGGETEVRIYEGEVEHFVSAESEGVGIRVVVDGRTGFSYAGTLDEDAIDEALASARTNAAFGTPDPYAGLAEPDGVEQVEQSLWSDDLGSFSAENKIALALDVERLALEGDARIRVESATYSDGYGVSAVATTTGIRQSGRENGCYVGVSTLADDGDETQNGFGYSVGRAPSDLDPAVAAGDGVTRAVRLLGATKPSSQRTTLVLDPMVTAQFVGLISATLSGEAVVKGRSIFADRLGQQIANEAITLIDDPTNPLAYTATEVDGEGLAARRNVLIEGGVLQMFTHNSYSARRADTVSTANAVRGGFGARPGVGALALSLAPGARQQPEIIADIDSGMLIQSVQGLHSGVNLISGDFSTGASGLTITGGELGAPVREFTIASTLQRMLTDVAEVGGDIDWLPSRAAGMSLVLHDVTVSGTT